MDSPGKGITSKRKGPGVEDVWPMGGTVKRSVVAGGRKHMVVVVQMKSERWQPAASGRAFTGHFKDFSFFAKRNGKP